ncbi:MAG: hypothetical protein L0Y73_07250, partial [Candidatus Aminicenantes bacterium]|nr:hypothetical protein [Candidatus Aminicenantes bacterium]
MKFVIVLCEGPHDVAFLYRVLKAGHFEICPGEIDKLPEILKNNLRQRFKKININNLELCDIRPGIPSMIMNKVSEQLYVVMHALGGKDKIKEAQNIIDGYHLLLPESET